MKGDLAWGWGNNRKKAETNFAEGRNCPDCFFKQVVCESETQKVFKSSKLLLSILFLSYSLHLPNLDSPVPNLVPATKGRPHLNLKV